MSDTRTPEAIVRRFIDAFRESWPQDLDAALAPLADDAYYQIAVPAFAPVRGRDAIKAELELMRQSVTDQRHDMKAVAASGNTVFTERCDWSFRNGRWVPVPLVAVFELNDAGQITAWREYLDPGHVAKLHGMSMEAFRESLAA
ncbi:MULTISPECIES: nuclear transport factor 2 family protein [Azohydromonas]|uniref:Nuclear transport factor 2 family protein n=1 Tax=Azohydromonas lata TaxID=45677 RepID=A0ABU5I888_9BURK|nr:MULTISPECIES: limonene-1,2-epoxide hydrolase family protein [Azohydromonas]MDZ5455122.1 nuclear transport factor 2 family protein [Azohydromonas lata]